MFHVKDCFGFSLLIRIKIICKEKKIYCEQQLFDSLFYFYKLIDHRKPAQHRKEEIKITSKQTTHYAIYYSIVKRFVSREVTSSMFASRLFVPQADKLRGTRKPRVQPVLLSLHHASLILLPKSVSPGQSEKRE